MAIPKITYKVKGITVGCLHCNSAINRSVKNYIDLIPLCEICRNSMPILSFCKYEADFRASPLYTQLTATAQ